MPYSYKFSKELEQYGLCSYRLTLTDSDSILPELNMPVILKQGEENEEQMRSLAEKVISQNTPTVVEEQPITEEQLITEEQPITEEQL